MKRFCLIIYFFSLLSGCVATPERSSKNPAEAPAPPVLYPRNAERQGQGGVVVVLAHVGDGGYPDNVLVEKSSGNWDLDKAAVNNVIRRRFSVKGYVRIPVAFNAGNKAVH